MSTVLSKTIRVVASPPDAADPEEIERLAKAEFQKERKEKARYTSDQGECAKIEAKFLDPAEEARVFMGEHCIGEFNRLLFWSGGFWYWVKGKFTSIPNTEVRAMIVKSINTRFTMVGMKEVSNVMEQVRAAALLSCQVQPPSWLNENEWKPEELFATENLIVHLPSFVSGVEDYAIPSSPAYFNTSALNYGFDATRPPSSNWLAFLSQLWPNDQQAIDTLQEWFGYCLTPDTRQQKILMMLGPKRSGKGTISRVLQSVVGVGNVCGPTFASLQTNFGLSPLIGKTVAIISDARLSGRADKAVITERLLSISGEDAQTIDRKYLEPVTTKLLTRFIIVSNELPRLQDSSGALAGRMIVLRLTETFYGNEDDALSDRLIQERGGILHWAIEGWKRLRERGRFLQPESGTQLLQQLDELSSPISAFVAECCKVGDSVSVETSLLYQAWVEWCKKSGREPSTIQTFGRDLTAYLPRLNQRQSRVHSTKRVRIYDGIRLNT